MFKVTVTTLFMAQQAQAGNSCSPGQFWDYDYCKRCDTMYYCPGGEDATRCPLDAPYTPQSSTSLSDCVSCPAGTYWEWNKGNYQF